MRRRRADGPLLLASLATLALALGLAPRAAGAASSLSDSTGAVRSAPATRVLRPESGPGPAFAIAARDSASGAWGVACASPSIACGARIPAAEGAVGAVAVLGAPTGAARDLALDALRRNGDAAAAIEAARGAGDDPENVQVAAVDARGTAEAWSGRWVRGWAGRRATPGVACVGQGLENAAPLEAMAAAFAAAKGDLAERLLAALAAAAATIDPEGAFADARGNASAALLVVGSVPSPGGEDSERLVDLRVDAADDPIPPIRRLLGEAEGTYLAAARVRRGDRARRAGDDSTAAREYALAETGFRSAVGRRPKDPDALNELAWFLATHGGDPAEALRFAEAAVGARGDDPNLYDTLAEAAYRAGNLDRAIEAAERAVKLARGNERYAERLRAFRAARAALTKERGSAP
ncbi:MAG: DUF1028 domain-containing protein [Hyphomicrobiales bacterium]